MGEEFLDSSPEPIKVKNSRKSIVAVIVLVCLVLGLFAINFISLQSNLNRIVNDDVRNKGINVLTHYDYYIDTRSIIYDLRDVEADKSMADIFRLFLQFSSKMADKNYNKVILSYQGKAKFYITGEYFQRLGKEFSTQNPVYTIRTFPENLFNMDGSKAFSHWTGGLIGVLKNQMEDFKSFNEKWFLDDLRTN